MGIAFVTSYDTGWVATGSPKTVSVTVAAGDFLAVLAGSGASNQIHATPTGGSLAYSFRSSSGVNLANLNSVVVFTAPAPAAQSFTLSMAISPSTAAWGFIVLQFSGVAGTGGTTSDSNPVASAPSSVLTATAKDSAVAMIDTDWNTNVVADVYRTTDAGTFTNVLKISNGSYGAAWAGYYLNAGAAGAKTIGMSAPNNQKWSMVSVELQPVVTAPLYRRPSLGALTQM